MMSISEDRFPLYDCYYKANDQVENLKSAARKKPLAPFEKAELIQGVLKTMKYLMEIHDVFSLFLTEFIEDWYVKSLFDLGRIGSDLGSGQSSYVVGKIYMRYAKGDACWERKALEYFTLARERGVEKATLRVALLLLSKVKSKWDKRLTSIVSILEKYENKDLVANMALAKLSKLGVGVPQSDERVKRLLNFCIARGSQRATEMYGGWYGAVASPLYEPVVLSDDDRSFLRAAYGCAQ